MSVSASISSGCVAETPSAKRHQGDLCSMLSSVGFPHSPAALHISTLISALNHIQLEFNFEHVRTTATQFSVFSMSGCSTCRHRQDWHRAPTAPTAVRSKSKAKSSAEALLQRSGELDSTVSAKAPWPCWEVHQFTCRSGHNIHEYLRVLIDSCGFI